MRELLLGIDIGTSACKVAVFDVNGNRVGLNKILKIGGMLFLILFVKYSLILI